MSRDTVENNFDPINDLLGRFTKGGVSSPQVSADTLDGVSSDELVPTGDVGDALASGMTSQTNYIGTPTITSGSVLSPAGVTSSAFGVQTSFFTTNVSTHRIHSSSDWQVSTDSGFTTIVDSVTKDRGNLITYAPQGLASSTSYYIRVRFYSGPVRSNWSAGVQLTTPANYTSIDPPVLSFGEDIHNVSSDTAFKHDPINVSVGVDTYDSTSFEIYELRTIEHRVLVKEFSRNMVTYSNADGYIPVGDSVLRPGRDYLMRVRINGDTWVSPYSVIEFSTRSTRSSWALLQPLPGPARYVEYAILPLSKRVVLLMTTDTGNTATLYLADKYGNGWVALSDLPIVDNVTNIGLSAYHTGGTEHVFVAGGTISDGPGLTGTYTYNMDTNAWTTRDTLSQGRYRTTLVNYQNNHIIAVGGKSGSTWFNSMERYDISTHTWTSTALNGASMLSVGVLLADAAVTMINDDWMFISGGSTGGGFQISSTAEYNPTTNTIRTSSSGAIPPLPQVVSNHGQTLLKDGRILIALSNSPAVSCRILDPNNNYSIHNSVRMPMWLDYGDPQCRMVTLDDGRVLFSGVHNFDGTNVKTDNCMLLTY